LTREDRDATGDGMRRGHRVRFVGVVAPNRFNARILTLICKAVTTLDSSAIENLSRVTDFTFVNNGPQFSFPIPSFNSNRCFRPM
jgi:hypothetical protein